MPGQCYQAQSSQADISFVLGHELPGKPFSLVPENTYDAPPLLVEDVLATINNVRSKKSGLNPIDGGLWGDQYEIALALLDQRKVFLGVLAYTDFPLAPLDLQSSASQNGFLFSAVIGEGTYKESLDVSVNSIENTDEASLFESYEAAQSSHDLSISIEKARSLKLLIVNMFQHNLGVKAPPIRIDSQEKYDALRRGDASIYLHFPHASYREKFGTMLLNLLSLEKLEVLFPMLQKTH
ncbi:SAL1 phosphatase [Bienertia sinuspersici]